MSEDLSPLLSLYVLAQSLESPKTTNDWKECLHELLRQRQQNRLNESEDMNRMMHEPAGYWITHQTSFDDTFTDVDNEHDGKSLQEQQQQKSVATEPFTYTSGGYADYIFRYAARELYGIVMPSVPWRPGVMTSSNSNNPSAYNSNSMTIQESNVSARVARSRKQQGFYEATLYQRVDLVSGKLEYLTQVADDITDTTPVLQFAMAHGMQTMQRAISNETVRGNFDYIEAMACPSGCLNGGGQVRTTSVGREAPRETQARLQAATSYFVVPTVPMNGETIRADSAGPSDMQTSFRKVPPMQLAMGAGKGVAVKDIQW
jgi:hypothetical protein